MYWLKNIKLFFAERNITINKIIRVIVHVNAHIGKRERYEKIKE